MHRCIVSEAQTLGFKVLAVGGMPDHVHLVVRMPSRVCPADLMKQVKGTSTILYNQLRPAFSEGFHWQNGYGCFSLWSS